MTNLIESYLTIAVMLVFILLPVLVPAAVSGTHAVLSARARRRVSRQGAPVLRLRTA